MPKNLRYIPQVAIITRTKDRPLLLERAIKSVLDQTFKDFSMVIMNDGGNARVVDTLVKAHDKKADGRIKVLHNSQSIGMQAAANKAIQSIDSEYVVVHDDDDSWHPEFLEKTIDHMDKTGAMGVVAATDLIVEKIEGKEITALSSERLFAGIKFINLYKMCFENYAAPISFIYKRSIFKKIGYYDETLRGFGDWDFGLRFLLHHDIEYLDSDRALAFYHQRPQTGDGDINKNSVFTDNQQYLENLMFNRYLRNDINSGKFGLGYIINSLRNNSNNPVLLHKNTQEYISEQAAHITEIINVNTSRLENSINRPSIIKVLPRKIIRTIRQRTTRRIND
jgi:glycosyltransferase involved in cell wall biosynthesis